MLPFEPRRVTCIPAFSRAGTLNKFVKVNLKITQWPYHYRNRASRGAEREQGYEGLFEIPLREKRKDWLLHNRLLYEAISLPKS